MAEAVDVARESADIVLNRRDFDVLRVGVEDGRRTCANTLRYISFMTSVNFGNMRGTRRFVIERGLVSLLLTCWPSRC